MERLSGIDATFLYLETPTAHMHVAMTGIYDASTMVGGYTFEAFREHIAGRLHRIPPFTRRLVEVPFKLHHPVWIEDPHFDLSYHVRRVAVPSPGGRRELAEIAAQIASVPLDRKRPLWEVWVIEGVKQNRIGLVAKVHHSAIDGASGAEIMTALYDLEPSPPPCAMVEESEPEEVPSDMELVSYALASKLRRSANVLPLLGRSIQGVANLINNRRDPHGAVGAVPLTAPRTPWSGAISAQRTVAFARIPLADAKDVKDALGVKMNDLVLAVCAGALRGYLKGRGELPEESLIAVCPVSVRSEEEANTGGNKVSAMFTSLATDIDDPIERVRAIQQSTIGAKTEHNAVGARLLTDWGEYAAPRTFAMASRLYSSMGLADRHRPIHNVVISNVPGPPFPLYLAGAELVAAYPMGPIMEGAGLNVTVLSYRDSIDFGFMADRSLVPDVWDLADAVQVAFTELQEAQRALSAKAPKKATAAKKTAKKATTPKKATAKKIPTAKKKAATKKAPVKQQQPARTGPTWRSREAVEAASAD